MPLSLACFQLIILFFGFLGSPLSLACFQLVPVSPTGMSPLSLACFQQMYYELREFTAGFALSLACFQPGLGALLLTMGYALALSLACFQLGCASMLPKLYHAS